MELVGGLPHLVSLELAYWGLGPVVAGIGFGSLPVNAVLKKNIPMDSRAISGGYTLLPDANYSFISISAFLRYFPFNENKGSGTFFELNVARWKFNASVAGDLREDSSGNVVGNALNGAIDLSQPMASLFIGYRSMLTQNLFLNTAMGATYLFPTTHSTVVSGTLTSVLPLATQPQIDSFEQAKADINTQVDDGINDMEATTKIIPAVWLSIGWVF